MIIIPAVLESYRSLKDKSIKVVFESNELTPEQVMGVAQNIQQFGYLAFKNEPFKNKEKEVLDNLKSDYEDTGKTPGQRLRGVLYRWYEKDKQGYATYEDFYRSQMEKLIDHFKTKLD